MANNITVTSLNGNPIVATDNDGTANYQWVKLQYGGVGTFTPVTATVGLPVNQATLLAGEDQVNNLVQTSGGAVRQTVVCSAVITNTTTTAVTIPMGTKTFYAQVVGTGAVTATIQLYGDIDNDAANGILIGTWTLSGTTRTQDALPVVTANFSFYYCVTTAVTGTGATVAVYAMY